MKSIIISAACLFMLVLLCPLGGQENGAYNDDDFYDDYDDFLDFGENPQGMTIIGSFDTTQQMIVIDRETIERSAARDLAALLQEETGMSIVRYGGYGNQSSLNLRGFSTSRIAILIDGVPANSPRSGQFDITQIDLDNVQRIEVIYGGSDTKYNVSGALGGVINIITIRRQVPGLNFGFAVSNTGYMPGRHNLRQAEGAIGGPDFIDLVDMQSLSLSAGFGAENFSWRSSLFANRAGNHYLYEDDYGFARRKISNEVLDGGGNFQFMLPLANDASILFDTRLYYAQRNFPITMDSVGSALAAGLTISENIIFAAPVIFRDELAADVSFTWQTSMNEYGDDYSNSSDHYLTLITRWNWYPTAGFTLRTGLDWRFLYINTNSPTELEPVKTGNLGGLYLTGEYSLTRDLLLIASLKGAADTKQAVLIPKLGFSWQMNPQFTLKNNYFRSFKFPDFDDLYYRSLDNLFVGNPELRPEDGWGGDIIGELVLNRNFTLVSTVFVQYIKDSIHWVKQGARWSPENIGTAFFTGIDFRPAFSLSLDRGSFTSLQIGPHYQFQYSWLLSGDLYFSNSYRIPYMPVNIIGGSIDLMWETGSLLLSAHFESTRYADTTNQLVLDPHIVAHATLNQDIGERFTLFVSLRNFLNAQYESFASYHMPGISLVTGFRARF